MVAVVHLGVGRIREGQCLLCQPCTAAKDLTRIRQNHGDTDDRRHELVENVRSGKITLEQAKTTAQRVRKQTQKAINAFYRSEGKKLMSHQDASWWISHKKELK